MAIGSATTNRINGCLGSAAKGVANTLLITCVMLDLTQRMADAGCTPVLAHHTARYRFCKQANLNREPLELVDLA